MNQQAKKLEHGDFTGLAEDYTKYRPDYSGAVLNAILGMVNKPDSEMDVADVGAGTGIWSRMLRDKNVKSVTAVEPNDDMRTQGQAHADNGDIKWLAGSGEVTGLADESVDLVSMASAFHWVDFDKGINEFLRVLRPGGLFVALWNPRFIENSPMLVEIENYVTELKGKDIKRVSSGRSDFTDQLMGRLEAVDGFSDVVYLEAKHVINFSQERYMGAWRSVNDLRVQLGDEKFQQFLDWVQEKIASVDVIEASYQTRAWVGIKKA